MASKSEHQVALSCRLLEGIFQSDLLGVYLYGSSVSGGLQKYSDIDLFVVLARPSTQIEKAELVSRLLNISGIYMQSEDLPIEMTIVVKSEINPWRYPPIFDFQYGEWLRKEFESGNDEPWQAKTMPDLAILITQVLLASKTLQGSKPEQLLCRVPYRDFMAATTDALPHLLSDIDRDTRNVLLTLARIWNTVATNTIRSKPDAADWAIHHLPSQYHLVIERAKAICVGETNEYWDDLLTLIQPCAECMVDEINKMMTVMNVSDQSDTLIHIA